MDKNGNHLRSPSSIFSIPTSAHVYPDHASIQLHGSHYMSDGSDSREYSPIPSHHPWMYSPIEKQELMLHEFEKLKISPRSSLPEHSASDSTSDESVTPGDSAHVVAQQRTAYVWNGELPPRNYIHPQFSCKLFVGGVPWDITEEALIEAFSPYGRCLVEWPGKEPRYMRSSKGDWPRGKVTGYVYIIFDHEKSVKALLQDCSQEFGRAGEWYFRLHARRNQTTEIRQVQVIPWVVSDSSYAAPNTMAYQDLKKTVFVGALHGMITAPVLFCIMQQLYGDVSYVTIDTDKYKYPIGSGRVCFSASTAYFRAIESAFVEIKTSKFEKRVQIDPFLEEKHCSITGCGNAGPLFCRSLNCFRYFCHSCWDDRHSVPELSSHRPLTRNGPRYPTEVEEHLQWQLMTQRVLAMQQHRMTQSHSARYGYDQNIHSMSTWRQQQQLLGQLHSLRMNGRKGRHNNS